MKARHRIFRRGGVYYAHDGDTRKQRSLGTRDKTEAARLLTSLEALRVLCPLLPCDHELSAGEPLQVVAFSEYGIVNEREVFGGFPFF